jgi:hypothetical protein
MLSKPGLKRWGFLSGLLDSGRDEPSAALLMGSLILFFPPVLFLAVCLVRAIEMFFFCFVWFALREQ